MSLSKSELKHLFQMLNDAADCLESYSEHEEFSQEIRATVNKLKIEVTEDEDEDPGHRPRLSDYLEPEEMTYSDELYEESKGEK